MRRKVAQHQRQRRVLAYGGGEPQLYADAIKAATGCRDELIDIIGGMMRDGNDLREGTRTGTLDALSSEEFDAHAKQMHQDWQNMSPDEKITYWKLYGSSS